jgi:hypothetical protein
MIVPETDAQLDPISDAPSLAKEIENEYGKAALEGLQEIGFDLRLNLPDSWTGLTFSAGGQRANNTSKRLPCAH